MFRSVIFDFDGVITDSEILHLRSFNHVLAQFNFEIGVKEYYRDYLGLSDRDLFTELVKKQIIKVPLDAVDKFLEQKKQAFEMLAKTDGKIIDGVPAFLSMLQKNNIVIAICSGALLVEIELILENAGLRHFFETIISADQVRKGKPDPEGFNLSLTKLNKNRTDLILPADCVVIEDSHWGLDAASSAGMHTVAITNSYDADQLSMAEKVISHLSELTISDLQQLCS